MKDVSFSVIILSKCIKYLMASIFNLKSIFLFHIRFVYFKMYKHLNNLMSDALLIKKIHLLFASIVYHRDLEVDYFIYGQILSTSYDKLL